jgi:hypothetical protein
MRREPPSPSRRVTLSALAVLLASQLAPIPPSRGAEPPVVRLGLAIHVPREAGVPAVDEAFLTRQLDTANRIFAPYGVAFEPRERHAHDGLVTRVETRAQRDSFGAFVRPRLINVFAVAGLMDVDEPGRVRRGVHWHSRVHRPAHYVILSGISFDAVLAHELGHFLGNREHSSTPGNLMSYQHTDVLPFLDEAQQRRMHARIQRYLRSGELRRLGTR